MTKDSIRVVIRRLSDLAELLDNPSLLPAVTVGEHSAGYLLRSIAVELGKKAEEEEKKK